MMPLHKTAIACSLGITLMVASGCQHLNLTRERSLKDVPISDASNPIVEMVCLWEAADGIGLDKKPCRGFAGQLLFFSGQNKAPIRLDGDLRIYVFDDASGIEERGKPIHQFDFDAGACTAFLTDTNLGAAYQMFIPYTRKGSHLANCEIRVRYTPKNNGNPVYSKMAKVILPGTARPRHSEMARARSSREQVEPPKKALKQVSYEIPINDSSRRSGSSESVARSDRLRLQERLAEASQSR